MKLSLPPAAEKGIVLFTGNSLRHERFALRIQQEFGEAVVGWYRVVGRRTDSGTAHGRVSWIVRRLKILADNPRSLANLPREVIRRLRAWKVRQVDSLAEAEQRLFGDEVRALRRHSVISPIEVQNPNDPSIVEQVRLLNPYFLLTLGGAIYQKPLLGTATGVALNQHDGWCPEYRGSGTVDWTLFHRDVQRIGNTVHLLTAGMDSGPIVRRTRACLVPEDTPTTAFVRVVAVGTELMCEVVSEAIEKQFIQVFDQPEVSGHTYRFLDRTPEVEKAVERDFQAGWLRNELKRLQTF